MTLFRLSIAATLLAGLAACNSTGMTGQSFPDRQQVSYRSADGVTLRNYACVPGANGARAHNYVDGEILEAEARFRRESTGGIGSGLGVAAEVRQEVARIARISEIDYKCAYLGSRDA
ncbi:hypothetical protein [Yoonia sp.]|uniref:hypothetical protein n=1 Tax=Yoonia sp. TaxID=2212373 RepID=UPI002FDAA5FC